MEREDFTEDRVVVELYFLIVNHFDVIINLILIKIILIFPFCAFDFLQDKHIDYIFMKEQRLCIIFSTKQILSLPSLPSLPSVDVKHE